MKGKALFSFAAGFVVLFFIYHFPEFFTAFWMMAVFKIGFLVVAFFLARLQYRKGLGAYGLGFASRWAVNLGQGLLTGFLFFALSVVASVKMGYEAITSVHAFSNIISQLPMILLMTAIPSVAEDILTRGYLFAHLQFMKPAAWIMLSAVVYVLNHIWRLSDGPAVLAYLFVLGMVLALAVQITKSLWLAFGIHWGANIAFESAHAFIQTKPLVSHNGTTWLLAASWALLLTLLFVYRGKSIFRPV